MCHFTSGKIIASFHIIHVTAIRKFICFQVPILEDICLFVDNRWWHINHWNMNIIISVFHFLLETIHKGNILETTDIWRRWDINHGYSDITIMRQLWDVNGRYWHLINWCYWNWLTHALFHFWALQISIPFLGNNTWSTNFSSFLLWFWMVHFPHITLLFLWLRNLNTWFWFVVNTLWRCVVMACIAYYNNITHQPLLHLSSLAHWS